MLTADLLLHVAPLQVPNMWLLWDILIWTACLSWSQKSFSNIGIVHLDPDTTFTLTRPEAGGAF